MTGFSFQSGGRASEISQLLPAQSDDRRPPSKQERRRHCVVVCWIAASAGLALTLRSKAGGRLQDTDEARTVRSRSRETDALFLRTIGEGDPPPPYAAIEGQHKTNGEKREKKKMMKKKKTRGEERGRNVTEEAPAHHQHHHDGAEHHAAARCGWVVDLFTEKYAGTTAEDELATQYRVQSADANYFYRATANIFWIDFVRNGWGDRLSFDALGVNTVHPDGEPFQPKSTWTWITGDQHLSNFGAWRNRHDVVVFGVNDFDEAAIYDFQVDVLRIAVSVVGHAYANGLSEDAVDVVLRAFTDTYIQTVVNYVGGDRELLFEITPETSTGWLRGWLESVRDDKSPERQLEKFTEKVDGGGHRRFMKNDGTRLVEVTEEEDAEIRDQFTSRKYGASMMKTGWHVRGWDDTYFEILDIARRVGSGVGSYGVDRYYILLRGKDEDAEDWEGDGNSVILDVKYEPSGAVNRVLSEDDAAWYGQIFDHDAQRAVEGQRRLTSYTDPFTGWVVIDGKPFVVRQRSPWKASPDLSGLTDPADYVEFMEQVATATATSHSRGTAAKSPGQFKHVIAAALGRWSDRTKWGMALAEVAKDYHDQVLLDFECFRKFVDDNYGGSNA